MNRVLGAKKTSARWEAIVTELIVQVRDNAKESESAGTEKNPLKKLFLKFIESLFDRWTSAGYSSFSRRRSSAFWMFLNFQDFVQIAVWNFFDEVDLKPASS